MVCELSPIRRVILDGLKGGVEEGLQETIQQIMGNPIAQELYDPERDTFTGAAKGAAVGFTVGDIFSTLGSMIAGGGQRGRRGAGLEEVPPEEPRSGPAGGEMPPEGAPQPPPDPETPPTRPGAPQAPSPFTARAFHSPVRPPPCRHVRALHSADAVA